MNQIFTMCNYCYYLKYHLIYVNNKKQFFSNIILYKKMLCIYCDCCLDLSNFIIIF